jgi:hypothetical protein
MQIHEVNNYRKFNIKYLGPTTHRGARVKITEPARYNDDTDKSVTLSSNGNDCGQQGLEYLISKGFKPVARCSEFSCYTILCDNWGENFIELT